MANSLTGYNLTYFANMALITLEQALGFTARVYRGYSPNAQQKGQTITIPVPSTFTAANAPSSVADLSTSGVSITLDQWKEVKFALPDDEQHFTHETIMQDHIRPAIYALALNIDSNLAAQYSKIPWAADLDETSDATKIASILEAQRILRSNGTPFDPGMIHCGLSYTDAALLKASEFMYSADKVGGGTEVLLRPMRNSIATRFGTEFFEDGQINTHTSGTVISAGTDVVGAANGAVAVDATSFAVDGLSLAETIVAGDSFVFAGHSQRYTATATTTLSSGAGTVSFYPALKSAVADNEVVTFEDGSGAAVHADSYRANMMFHRNAFALATAPLSSGAGSQQARAQGIEVEQVSSPESNLSLRARMWYDPDNSRNIMAFDVLYGYQVLDPNLAVLFRGDV